MINCTVRIFKDVDVLEHGRHAGEASNLLFAGPAYLAGPSQAWQQAAALEGVLSGSLHVHTATDLQGSTRVAVADNAQDGTWQVAENGVSGTGNQWRLTLARRRDDAS